MRENTPTLFIEINHTNFIFIAGLYDDNNNFKTIEKIISKKEGIDENKFTNIELINNTIKTNIKIIEEKLNHIFQDVTIILDHSFYSSINISGFKKLNGSQVLKENISYILNSLKLAVTENEKEQTILHIFNSKSVLDGKRVENLPIGLFGDFYSHELTFFLIKNNDLKNIKQVFNKNSLNVRKILIKNFIEGAELVDKDKNDETFFKVKINKESSNLSFFDKASFRYVESFKFGTNIILRDIKKVCSIDNKIIEKFLSDKLYKNQKFSDNEILDEKYFIDGNFRKIRKRLIFDIVKARIEEINNIILNKNINLAYLKKNDIIVYLTIEDENIIHNFKENFVYFFPNYKTHVIENLNIDKITQTAAQLSIYGWKKEAIPITQTKNSLITRIFKSLFG
tara:strand:+ start:485 stop:1675 length:1191 start_codon:yes stop_codon:yes gene_type:complete